ncbi:MAG: hypothetical protein IH888_13205, partial [Planctomycetes bacterium]|nr:hypothetical protein [Planctomycetota bacterium]
MNEAREVFIESLARHLWEQTPLASVPGSLQAFVDDVRPSIESQINADWPVLDLTTVYVRFLSDPDNLVSIGKG